MHLFLTDAQIWVAIALGTAHFAAVCLGIYKSYSIEKGVDRNHADLAHLGAVSKKVQAEVVIMRESLARIAAISEGRPIYGRRASDTPVSEQLSRPSGDEVPSVSTWVDPRDPRPTGGAEQV